MFRSNKVLKIHNEIDNAIKWVGDRTSAIDFVLHTHTKNICKAHHTRNCGEVLNDAAIEAIEFIHSKWVLLLLAVRTYW